MSAPITPQPTPFTFLVGEATTDQGQRLITVELHTVTGMHRLFMAPEDAEQMADHWLQAARRARTGLVLPGAADLAAVAHPAQLVGNGNGRQG